MSRPGFSFLVCPDFELLRHRQEQLLAEHGGGSQWEKKVYWADDDELPGSFWDDLGIASLLGSSRLVVLRRAESFKAAQWDALHPRLGSFNASVWPVFCLESSWTRPKGNKGPSPKIPRPLARQKYWQLAEKRDWVWMSPGLTPRTMPQFARSVLEAAGARLPRPLERRLCASLPMDATGARNELEKLAMAVGPDAEIKADDLDVLTHRADMDIFAFLEALMRGGSPEEVWRKVFSNRLAKSSEKMLFPFLGVMQRELRILWQLGVGEKPSGYVPARQVRAKEDLARKLGQDGLSRLWNLVMEADYGIKSGQRNEEQALEALIAGMYAVLSSTTRTRRG